MQQPETRCSPGTCGDTIRLYRIREKFHDVFGTSLTLPDEVVLQRYSLTSDGDLVMILR
jgi:hypothetical protein